MTGSWRTPVVVLICGTIILSLAFGLRQSFGIFLAPISADLGWGREVFSIAMALQNLVWGLSQPFSGALADRFGPAKVVGAGAVLYVAGLYLMSQSTTPGEMIFSNGILTGLAMSGTGFPIILSVISRNVSPDKRSQFLGIGTALGSSGQLFVLPLSQYFLTSYGWATALLLMTAMAAIMVPMAAAVVGEKEKQGDGPRQSLSEAVREASGHRGYLLLIVGFFVCGFQTMFIGAHLPAYLLDQNLSANLGTTALMLIGLFNVFGTYTWGALGDRFPKKYLLSLLYALRSVVMAAFFLAPVSEVSVILFSSSIGLLWLGTIPLTSGLIAQIFGLRYMATLYGFVFMNHQIGAFLGVWMAGRLFDTTGSYDAIWWGGVILGLLAGFLHFPIDERALPRLAVQK